MQIYLVGGAVRDELLDMPIKERDWVVVGSTPQEMLRRGFKQVGKDFPVFLHPKTKEEYALARTERKTGHGYDGFTVHADASVSLQEDLERRDLTINAIAKNEAGELIDFFGGRKDLNEKVLRHVSDAFIEDPLRLVRLCRFQARFPTFSIHSSTIDLCKKIVDSGEIDYLTPERVWLEWQKVFSASGPERFIETLDSLGAWQVLMPAFTDTKQDSQRVLMASKFYHSEYLFCVLGWYLDYEDRKKQLQKLRIPKDILQMSLITHSIFLNWKQNAFNFSAEALLVKFQQWDVYRRQERFIQACQIVQNVVPKHHRFQEIVAAANTLSAVKPDSQTRALTGQEIAENLYKKRLIALSQHMKSWVK